jgi:hypothetical protein
VTDSCEICDMPGHDGDHHWPHSPELFAYRADRLRQLVTFNAPAPVVVIDCWLTMKAYYGSATKVFTALVKRALWACWHRLLLRLGIDVIK